MSKNRTTEDFINIAKSIHGDKYDYSKVKYINQKSKIILICPIHGEFELEARYHILNNNIGCKKCVIELDRKINKEKFIEKSKNTYNDKYDYSLVDYVNTKTKVKIICPEHGIFKQTPGGHRVSGCLKCGYQKTSKNQQSNTEEFINKAKKIHKNKYNYSKVSYKKSNSKIIIICPKHGEFTQKPNNHLNNKGCPKCRRSLGEESVEKILTLKNIKFETQKTFDGCKNKRNLRFDFYLPKQNLCIEYHGDQHYNPSNHIGGQNGYDYLVKNDKIKKDFCNKNGISYIELNKYSKIDMEIDLILSTN